MIRRGMRWVVKGLVQGALSRRGRGEALNYLLQRHVTGSLPAPDGVFSMHVEEARAHFDALRRHSPAGLLELRIVARGST